MAAAVGSRAGLGRCLDLALFPLADLALFVAPTFHAHAAMAFGREGSFVYEVAPKGRPAAGGGHSGGHTPLGVLLPSPFGPRGANGSDGRRESQPLLAVRPSGPQPGGSDPPMAYGAAGRAAMGPAGAARFLGKGGPGCPGVVGARAPGLGKPGAARGAEERALRVAA